MAGVTGSIRGRRSRPTDARSAPRRGDGRSEESILSGAPFFYLRDDFDRSLGLIGRVAKLIPHAVNKE